MKIQKANNFKEIEIHMKGNKGRVREGERNKARKRQNDINTEEEN